MKYFKKCTNEHEARALFAELSHTLHPDKGGNADTFAAMKQEYEEWKILFKHGVFNAKTENKTKPPKVKATVKTKQAKQEKPPEIPTQPQPVDIIGNLRTAAKGLDKFLGAVEAIFS